MARDGWLARELERHAFVAYHCHHCGEAYYSTILFAAHLVADHDVRTPTLVRFTGRDSDDEISGRPNRSRRRANGLSRSL